jgi:hypothetical protein
MQDGFAVAREFRVLQETLRAPPSVLNSCATEKVRIFFVKVVKLCARIKQFQRRRGGHVAFAVFPYDLAGQGKIQSPMPRRNVLMSQTLSKCWANNKVQPEYA